MEALKDSRGLLGRIFRHGLRYRWVDANPVAVAVKVKPHGKVTAWTPDQIAAMLDKADADTAIFLRVAISTGARLGELSGLRWSDIDLATGIVAIAQQFTAGAFSELKTDASRRRIPLPQEVLKQLKLWKLRCPTASKASCSRARADHRLTPRTSITAYGVRC